MDKIFLNSLGWGVGLWFVGYVLGIVLFGVVPVGLIGWIITPIGIALTLWVLVKKINPPAVEAKSNFIYYLKIAVAWTVIAVVFDYLFLVLVFKPADGYYKLDVYLYYFFTFALPLIVGGLKKVAILCSGGNLIDKQAKEKEENKNKILKLLDSQGQITNEEVEKALGVSAATAERYFDELEGEGKIKQVGKTGRSVFYSKV